VRAACVAALIVASSGFAAPRPADPGPFVAGPLARPAVRQPWIDQPPQRPEPEGHAFQGPQGIRPHDQRSGGLMDPRDLQEAGTAKTPGSTTVRSARASPPYVPSSRERLPLDRSPCLRGPPDHVARTWSTTSTARSAPSSPSGLRGELQAWQAASSWPTSDGLQVESTTPRATRRDRPAPPPSPGVRLRQSPSSVLTRRVRTGQHEVVAVTS